MEIKPSRCHIYMKRLGFIFSSFIFFIFFFPLQVFTQTQWISGKIVDEKGKSVPFVSIVNKAILKFSMADSAGNFSIQGEKGDSLLFSCIGFEIGNWVFRQSGPIQVTLRSKTYSISGVTFEEMKAENLLRSAIRKFSRNYPQKTYTYQAFFRQSHQENKKWVRLVEVDLQVMDLGYSGEEKMIVKQMRRSRVYERNKDIHGDHLAELFEENTVHYPAKFFTNPFNLGRYRFKFDTTYVSDSVTRILFFLSSPDEIKVTKGFIDISLKDTAILQTLSKTSPNKNFALERYERSNWKFNEGSVSVKYQKVDDKYFLSSIQFYYEHDIYNPVFKTFDFKVKENFDLWVYRVDLFQPVPSAEKFSFLSNLYRRQYEYDAAFWEKYPPVIKHPISAEIILDLEREFPLAEQFLEN
jgi:hypothetical protein